ncbi:hypothetical protein ABZ345_05355 [Lentzea sp. NPDC005914]
MGNAVAGTAIGSEELAVRYGAPSGRQRSVPEIERTFHCVEVEA